MERATTVLRRLFAEERLIVAPGATDAFTARLVESMGFEAAFLGGNALGIHLCNGGEPFTTLTETVDAANRIMRGCTVPLVVDGQAGFGDATGCYRTVLELERAGAAAVHLEDQVFPKVAGYFQGGGRIVPVDAMLDKLQAAFEARRDPDFMIFGRTDALSVGQPLAEAIERGQAYAEAGVDAVMVVAQQPEHGPVVRREVPGIPLVWVSGAGLPQLSNAEIEAMGYQLALYPSAAFIVIAEAVLEVFGHLRDHGTLGMDDDRIRAMRAKIHQLIGMPTYLEIERRSAERAASRSAASHE
jgi:2-methylisocitrate lyase-like PEP mutase family enzyme